MKQLEIFVLDNSPYCKAMVAMLKQYDLTGIEVTFIDVARHPELAEQYDYSLTPAFFLDGQLLFEGAIDGSQMEKLIEKIKA